MEDLEAFEVLELLVEGNYNSEFYTFVGKVDGELHFRKQKGKLYRVGRDGNNILTEDGDFRHERTYLAGSAESIKHVKKLLNNPAYIGCSLTNIYDAYYFKKFGKIYEYMFSEYTEDDGIVSTLNTDCDNMIYQFATSKNVTQCNLQDFVELILHTNNVKPARSYFFEFYFSNI